jgi:hypothetical protein
MRAMTREQEHWSVRKKGGQSYKNTARELPLRPLVPSENNSKNNGRKNARQARQEEEGGEEPGEEEAGALTVHFSRRRRCSGITKRYESAKVPPTPPLPPTSPELHFAGFAGVIGVSHNDSTDEEAWRRKGAAVSDACARVLPERSVSRRHWEEVGARARNPEDVGEADGVTEAEEGERRHAAASRGEAGVAEGAEGEEGDRRCGRHSLPSC